MSKDISVQVKALAKKFGVDLDRVTCIDITPSLASVWVLKTNEDGKPYIDSNTNEAAVEVLHFDVTTKEDSPPEL